MEDSESKTKTIAEIRLAMAMKVAAPITKSSNPRFTKDYREFLSGQEPIECEDDKPLSPKTPSQHPSNIPQKRKSKQEKFEDVLTDIIKKLQKENHDLDLKNLPYTHEKMQQMFPFEFKKLAISTFKDYWKKQKICSLEPGAGNNNK